MKHPVVEFREKVTQARENMQAVHLSLDLAIAIERYLPVTEYIPDLWDGRRHLHLYEPSRGGTVYVGSREVTLPLDKDGRADESKIPDQVKHAGKVYRRQPHSPMDKPPHFFIHYISTH